MKGRPVFLGHRRGWGFGVCAMSREAGFTLIEAPIGFLVVVAGHDSLVWAMK
jgi:hypothetical protein